MTLQTTATTPGREGAVRPDWGHQHDGACFWHVDECRWQCPTSTGVGYAPEVRPTVGRLGEHPASEIRT